MTFVYWIGTTKIINWMGKNKEQEEQKYRIYSINRDTINKINSLLKIPLTRKKNMNRTKKRRK